MSLIINVDGLFGNMTGTVYRGAGHYVFDGDNVVALFVLGDLPLRIHGLCGDAGGGFAIQIACHRGQKASGIVGVSGR